MANRRTMLSRSLTLNERNIEVKDHESVITVMRKLFVEGLYSDVVLIVGEHRFAAHKTLLNTHSEAFKVLLSAENTSESQEVTLDVDEKCQEFFGQFLQFIYTGEVSVNQNNVMQLFILAEKFNVQKLQVACRGFFTSNVSALTNGNMVKWLPELQQNGRQETYTKCLDFLQANMAIVCDSESFLNVDATFLTEMLQSSNVVVQNEELLFEFLENWLRNNESNEDYKTLATKLISFIRYPMMTSKGREKVLSSDLCEKFSDAIFQRLRLAAKAQLGTLESSLQASSELNAEMLNPRIYTTKNWIFTVEISDDMSAVHTCDAFIMRTLENPCQLLEFSLFRKPKNELKCRMKVYPFGRQAARSENQVPHSPKNTTKETQVDISLEVLDIYGKLNAKVSILHFMMSTEGVLHVADVISWYHWFSPSSRCLDIDNIHSIGNPAECYMDNQKNRFLFAINIS